MVWCTVLCFYNAISAHDVPYCVFMMQYLRMIVSVEILLTEMGMIPKFKREIRAKCRKENGWVCEKVPRLFDTN